jgi:Sulfite exporter TauE/SafE
VRAGPQARARRGKRRRGGAQRSRLDAISVKQDGKAASATTISRKRSVFANVIRYAVELEEMPSNPLDRMSWTPPKVSEVVDRRVASCPYMAGRRAIPPRPAACSGRAGNGRGLAGADGVEGVLGGGQRDPGQGAGQGHDGAVVPAWPASETLAVAVVMRTVTALPGAEMTSGAVSPDWPTGIALGVGDLAGTYTGARIQGRLPDALIRRVMGVLVIAIGARYLWAGLD